MEAPDSSSLPDRSRPARMPVFHRDNLSIVIFLTVCTKQRKRILANGDAMTRLVQAWCVADFWIVGKFVVMPDHIHIFAAPAVFPEYPFRKWVDFWKREVSTRWLDPKARPIFQKEGWDTQLRKGESYHRKWEYVWNNPVRHGFVQHPEDWPYQGELHPLQWHEP